MRIAIDASRSTRAQRTGTEQYSLALLRALIRQNREYSLTLYFRDRPAPDLLPTSARVRQRIIPSPRLWTHARFAAAIWRERPALTFVPAHSLPLAFPGPAIVTVHDLGFRHFPLAHPPRQRRYLDWSTRHSARRAKIVLCDSQATAVDLQHFYDIPAKKLRVVYPGLSAPKIGDTAALRSKYDLPPCYFLHVGTLQPRKNIAMLVAAFQSWLTQQSQADCALVLAGRRGWLFEESWLSAGRNLRPLGYVAEEDIGALYAGARALLFPALHEGFGFPALEAMHCGTPVLASDRASLPEVVGDAGLLLDAHDEGAWANALARINTDEALRRRLIERGQQQAQRFRWEKSAQQTLAAFAEVLG